MTEHEKLLDLWVQFLAQENLSARIGAQWEAIYILCHELAKTEQRPKYSPYAQRLKTRDLICQTAMKLNIDLANIKVRGKVAMRRGLLDAWNLRYQANFGTVKGTKGDKEATRRNIKSRKPGEQDG